MVKKCSFDFDDTLCGEKTGIPNPVMIELLHKHFSDGCDIYIVTARDERHECEEWQINFMPNRVLIKEFIKQHKLPVKEIHYTCHEPKGWLLKELGIELHYDDSLTQLESAKEHGIEAIHPKDVENL